MFYHQEVERKRIDPPTNEELKKLWDLMCDHDEDLDSPSISQAMRLVRKRAKSI